MPLAPPSSCRADSEHARQAPAAATLSAAVLLQSGNSWPRAQRRGADEAGGTPCAGRAARLGAASTAVALLATLIPAPVAAAPVLRSAQVAVTIPAPGSCEVSLTLVVEGASTVDHRLESPDGIQIDGPLIQGARAAGQPQLVGRTRSIVLAPELAPYTIRYRVQQDHDRRFRCPLWLPAVPSDGRPAAIEIRVALPPGATPGSTMPRFIWNGSSGVASLAHMPAFVLLPFAAGGEPAGWRVGAVMDVTAVVVFACASALWLWRRRR